MNRFSYVILFVVAVILTVNGSPLRAQLFSNSAKASIGERSDFQVTTAVGLDLSGFNTETSYSLSDELGVKYDVMSLLRDSEVKSQVGLSQDQYKELVDISKTTTDQISKMLLNGAAIDDRKPEIETVFRKMQDELFAVMEPEQIDRLQQSRFQQGIGKHGVAAYLATNSVREEFGFSDKQLERLDGFDEAFMRSFSKRTAGLPRQANESLLQNLPDENRIEFNFTLNEDERDKFLGSKLFAATLKDKPARNFAMLVGLTRDRQLRDEIGLTGAAADEVKLLKRQIRNMDDHAIEDAITKLLSASQLETLVKLTIMEQIRQMGTANALCYGMLAREIGLTKDEAGELYATAEKIGKELAADLQSAKLETLREGLSSLPSEQVEKVCELVGDLKVTR